MNHPQEVSPTKALALIKKGALLVDVRQPKEVARKSFDVSEIMLIPVGDLSKRFQEIPLDRKVIIACHVGNRGLMATRFLMNQGYTKALNMQQGIVRWEKEGLPVKCELKQKSGSWLMQLFKKFGR
ncbi:MAG: rhodanese-like domain-containing protein [Chlorobiaceae bacterium]|nr:rhodanese-like domain-containing protein [Chlorobiaceae bacterium]